MLPTEWHVQDEMYVVLLGAPVSVSFSWCTFSRYNFKSDPRAIGAVVLLSANESSYSG